jgi:hypothetical protein
MSGASGELSSPVDEAQFTPRLPRGSAYEWGRFPVRDSNVSQDAIEVTGENTIRIVEGTIEAADKVIRATEIVKQTLRDASGLNAEEIAAQKDFGELRTARDDALPNQAFGAKTRSSIHLLFAAGGGILAISVALALILIGMLPLSKVEEDTRAVGPMTDVADTSSPNSIIPGAIMAQHDGGGVREDVQVGVSIQGVSKKPMVVNPASAETSLLEKVADDPTHHLKPDQIAELIERGSEFVGIGDLNSARLLFERAAEARDPKGAFALAATYDPIVLEQMGIRGPAADVQMARVWYQKAEKFGSPGAPRRLELLASRDR